MATLLQQAQMYEDPELRKRVRQQLRNTAGYKQQLFAAGQLYPADGSKRAYVKEACDRIAAGSDEMLNRLMGYACGDGKFTAKAGDSMGVSDEDIASLVDGYFDIAAARA